MTKPSIGLLHNSLNNIGGAEFFCVDLLNILKHNGYKVNLATFDKVNWTQVQNYFGKTEKSDKEICLLPFKYSFFTVYQRLLVNLRRNALKSCSDLTINTHSDTLFFPTDLAYIHGVMPQLDINQIKTQFSTFKIPYMIPYQLITSHLKDYPSVFVANSLYTKQRLLDFRGVTAKHVIYPPIHTELYRDLATHVREQDIVVTVGRFAKEKNLVAVLDIAERTKSNILFIIIGQANNKIENHYYTNLIFQVMKRKLSSKVLVFKNIPQNLKRKMLSRAKVYLQPSTVEHFGIALAEAISAGCLPVAVNKGGSLEIIENITEPYRTFEEAAEMVEYGCKNWSPVVAQELSSRMERFNLKRFENEMLNLVEEVGTQK